MKRITVQICCRDRHTEIALLMQSLRTQTFQDWDLLILDECGMPIVTNYFCMSMINRLKLENHCVNVYKNDLSLGVCQARNKAIEVDFFDNPFVL